MHIRKIYAIFCNFFVTLSYYRLHRLQGVTATATHRSFQVTAQKTYLHLFFKEPSMFAPLVILLRSQFGKREFNQMRGKVIAMHSKVITAVCNRLGVDRTDRQNLMGAITKS